MWTYTQKSVSLSHLSFYAESDSVKNPFTSGRLHYFVTSFVNLNFIPDIASLDGGFCTQSVINESKLEFTEFTDPLLNLEKIKCGKYAFF